MRQLKENNEAKINRNEIYQIPPYLIKPNPSLSRTEFPDTSLVSLADSIRRYGVLQPLVVHYNREGKYELIAGERRLRACILLKCNTVPCTIINEDEDIEYLSVVENMQQEKLNMFDISKSLARIIGSLGKNIKECSRLLSMSEEELEKKLRLQNFTRAEMQAILNLGISEEKANLLVEFPKEIRYNVIKLTAEKELVNNTLSKLLERVKNENKGGNIQNIDIKCVKNMLSEIYKSEEFLCENQETEKKQTGKTVILLNSLQLFENSIKKNCEILQRSGLEVEFISEYYDNNTGADYIISVKKSCDNEFCVK